MNRNNIVCFTKIIIVFTVIFVLISCEDKPTDPKMDNPFDRLNPQTGGDPFQLTAKIAGGGITLEWNKPNFKELRYYLIYRSEQELERYVRIASSEINQPLYVDKNIQNGHSYWYRITAVGEYGDESKMTNTAGVNIKTELVLVINGGAQYTPAREVSLTILAISAQQMILSNSVDFTSAHWVNYTSSKNWLLTTGDGQKIVYMKVKYDSSESEVVTANILPQSMDPAFTIISSTAKYTPSRIVPLSVSVSGANLQMKSSEDSTFIGVNWQILSSTPDFQLSGGEGQKKLFAKFKNDFDIESSVLKDDIILDTTPPTIALTFFPDSGVTNETEFHFDPTGSTDNLSPAEDMQFRVDYENDGTYDLDWASLSTVRYQYLIGGGDKTIRMQLSDGAGWQVEIFANIFVNTRVNASFTVDIDANNYKYYHFDASESYDYEDGKNIEYRWDFNGDDIWDTDWQKNDTANYEYATYGDYTVKLIVRDQNSLMAKTTVIIIGFDGTVTDIDDNIYQAVKIGTQWWMAENLKVTHYSNGDTISYISDQSEWRYTNTGAFCAYNNDVNAIQTYGLLYNKIAVDDNRSIAPRGWHVPTDEEWKRLEIYLGMSASDADNIGWRGTDEGSKLKAATGWNSDGNGTNESGFTALPGGWRSYRNGFYDIGFYGGWWTSGLPDWNRRLYNGNTGIERNERIWYSNDGYSVRCVKD